jgi:hypothetical protein
LKFILSKFQVGVGTPARGVVRRKIEERGVAICSVDFVGIKIGGWQLWLPTQPQQRHAQ